MRDKTTYAGTSAESAGGIHVVIAGIYGWLFYYPLFLPYHLYFFH